jgi:hypothetical protein
MQISFCEENKNCLILEIDLSGARCSYLLTQESGNLSSMISTNYSARKPSLDKIFYSLHSRVCSYYVLLSN